MRICPKIDTNDCKTLNNTHEYLSEYLGLEIQFLTLDLLNELSSIENVIKRFPNIKYYCFHTSMKLINITFIMLSQSFREQYIEFLDKSIELSNKYNIRIDVLSHLITPVFEFSELGGDEFVLGVDEKLRDTNVSILLENSMVQLNYSLKEENSIEYLFDKYCFTNVRACIDICHLQASENVLSRKIGLSKNLIDNISNIHFSWTKDNDGYRKKKETHGVGHESYEDFLKDITYIKEKGIALDTLNIVTEINENDYQLRPNMMRELAFFRKLLKDEVCRV